MAGQYSHSLSLRDAKDVTMNLAGILAVAVGGAAGCLLRWGLALAFNPLFPTLPIGTLAANLAGALLMGMTLGAIECFPTIAPATRLFLATGFLGGLTTFSTFAAEAVALLLGGRYAWFAAHVAANLLGSIGLVILGLMLMRLVFRPA
jgi:CrcB protein